MLPSSPFFARVQNSKEKAGATDRRKCKGGWTVAQRKLSEQKLQQIHELAAEWGKIVARRAFPESGPLDFATMEQIALAAAAGLTEGTRARSP
jgi:hypothetical protein